MATNEVTSSQEEFLWGLFEKLLRLLLTHDDSGGVRSATSSASQLAVLSPATTTFIDGSVYLFARRSWQVDNF
jgi:hypothetical protein